MFSATTTRAFRRLAGKTQVVHAPSNDHVATRLIHTLEVASIARDLARGVERLLGPIDHDLVENIALSHDLGHPPFGHAGEAVLARLAADAGLGGFHHAAFGVRLLTHLERPSSVSAMPSADLLDGILAHSKGKSGQAFAQSSSGSKSRSLKLKRRRIEALVVRAADLYAYASGDLDDARRLGVFRTGDLPERARKVLGDDGPSVRRELVGRTLEAMRASPADGVHLDTEGDAALAELRAFLYEQFYEGPPTVDQTRYAREVLVRLWQRFTADLGGMLDAVGWHRRETATAAASESAPSGSGTSLPTLRDALDAIACMTDRFAIAAAG